MNQLITLINKYYDYTQNVPIFSMVNVMALLGYSSIVWSSFTAKKAVKKSFTTKLFILGELGFLLTLPSFDKIQLRILHLLIFYISQIYVISQAVAYHDSLHPYTADAGANNSNASNATNKGNTDANQ